MRGLKMNFGKNGAGKINCVGGTSKIPMRKKPEN